MATNTRASERASAILMAIVMVVVVAFVVGAVTITTMRSSERSADASRRVSNDATVQAAVTRILNGFQNDLGSEQDYYTLDKDDLIALSNGTGSTSQVFQPNELPGLPPEFQQVDDIYEHVLEGGAHKLRLVADPHAVQPSTIVADLVPIDAALCTTAGLPATTCAGTVQSFWQVYRTVVPDITGSTPPHVVLYVRSWLGSTTAGRYSKASMSRIELRPGRFADFQQISDGNVLIGASATINGPVHSNGLSDGSFSTVHEAPAGEVNGSDRWIYVEPGASCSGDASLSITRGVIASNGCPNVGETGQTISFMRVADSVESIRHASAAGRPGVHVFVAPANRRGDEEGLTPYATAWDVRLDAGARRAYVDYPDGSSAGSVALDRVNALLLDEDVRIRGTAASDVRVTIAAERTGGGAASIFIDGNLKKQDDRTSAIGLISQGDVVLWMSNTGASSNCPVYEVQSAIVAASGGLTIPTNYTTDELQPNAPKCSGTLRIDGSIAAHRPPLSYWSWSGDTTFETGFVGQREYSWDKQLKRNPPPFFPLTGTWQPYQVREANGDCLFDPTSRFDPECR